MSTLPHRRDQKFLGVRRGLEGQNVMKSMKRNWNFQQGRGGGVLGKVPPLGVGGGVWIFPGTTHCAVTCTYWLFA